MSKTLFRPFERYNFAESVCYLTGNSADLQTTVFPAWILDQFGLANTPFKMLDERVVTYKDITIPVSYEALSAINKLDEEIRIAFNNGYETVQGLDGISLFQWIAKQVYGIIHWEIRAGIRQQRLIDEEFVFSQSIAHKFSNLHIMLQSLVHPVEFEGISPWSIQVFPVQNPPEKFSYRDEINTLVFSLRMKDFGIIASLQDNGESFNHHKEILHKIAGQKLHPIQFEELCAKFFYSAYLFNRLPEYTVISADATTYIEAMPLRIGSKPVYDLWQAKTYGQVLENFWKPWGLLLFEIIKNPEKPLSFLEDEEGKFIPSDQLELAIN